MYRFNKYLIIPFGLGLMVLLLSSCFNHNGSRQIPIARVHDKLLYASDLVNIFPSNISKEDSINILNAYVEKWIRHQLLLYRAENNLSEQQKDVAKQLEDYRSSLLIFKYEQEYLRQKLDTAITMDEIEQYYNTNKFNFTLDQTIVKALYIKIRKDSPYINKFKELYKSTKDEDIKSLDNLAYQAAVKYDYFNDTWITLDRLQIELPTVIENPDEYLKNKESIEQEDFDYVYLVNIRSSLFKESISPLEYEIEKIKSIIINKRKQELIEKLENGIYNDALNRKNFETYLK